MRAPVSPRTATLALVGALALTGCTDEVAEGCTEVGGVSGIAVVVPAPVLRGERTVEVEVCQDERCELESEAAGLDRDDSIDQLRFHPSGFGSRFGAGPAQVTVRDGDRVVDVLEGETELSYAYPNGRRCDGDQFLSGRLDLT